MALTFIDSGILIAAARGNEDVSAAAQKILDDATRTFASSVFIKMETIPYAVFFQREEERQFYEAFFDNVSAWAEVDLSLAEAALVEASRINLGAMDSLHVAAAQKTGSVELYTTERTTKPMHQTNLVSVKTVQH